MTFSVYFINHTLQDDRASSSDDRASSSDDELPLANLKAARKAATDAETALSISLSSASSTDGDGNNKSPTASPARAKRARLRRRKQPARRRKKPTYRDDDSHQHEEGGHSTAPSSDDDYMPTTIPKHPPPTASTSRQQATGTAERVVDDALTDALLFRNDTPVPPAVESDDDEQPAPAHADGSDSNSGDDTDIGIDTDDEGKATRPSRRRRPAAPAEPARIYGSTAVRVHDYVARRQGNTNNSYVWSSGIPRFRHIQFGTRKQPGLKVTPDPNWTPVDYFQLMFTREVSAVASVSDFDPL